jgi:hypothetical protein
VVEREPRHRPALAIVHRFPRGTEIVPVPGLHLYEHGRVSIPRDDVQFSIAAAIPAGNNCVPTAFELAARQILAGFPESDSSLRHAPASCKPCASRRTPRINSQRLVRQ